MQKLHRELFGLTRGHRGRYVLSALCLTLGSAFLFAAPMLTAIVLDGVLGDGLDESSPAHGIFQTFPGLPELLKGRLGLVGLGIVLLTLAGGAFYYLRGRHAAKAAEAITRDLRDRLFDHLQHLPCKYHDRADTGDLVQRCSSDVETVRVFLAEQIVELGRIVILLAVVVPAMLHINLPMTFVALSLFPVIAVFGLIFFRRVQRVFLDMDEAEGAMTAALQENLTGIRVVRAFARQGFEKDRFGRRNARYRDLNYRLIRLLSAYWSTSDFLCVGQSGVVLFVGAAWIRSGDLSIGGLFLFTAWVNLLIWPLRQSGRVLAEAGKALVAFGRISEVLDQPREQSPSLTAEDLEGGVLEFKNLSFSYQNSAPVLRDFSLTVAPGETVAFVGPPGSGKTTLMQLLLRLHDYEEGEIRLDGRELRDLPRKQVRSLVSAVMQEPFLYSKTLRANIASGRANVAAAEVEASARAACIHDTIEGFSEGYETLVGERGVTLSGGQRQRVAIARALLVDAPILILDDALSAVDTLTEANIREALARRRTRATTLIIAHRLSSVVEADRIVVLEGGRIVQLGSHRELLLEEGPYQRLWTIQAMVEDELQEDLRIADSMQAED